MSFFAKLAALITAILIAVTGVSQSVIGFTEGEPIQATKHDYCFDNDKLLIGAYYGDPSRVKEAAEAGIEFFIDSSVSESYLDECQKYGIGIIAGGYNFTRDYGNSDSSTVDRWVNSDVSQYKNHAALWGDDLIDEPGADSYENLSRAIEAYKVKHPEKIGLINLFPMYANEEQLNCDSELNAFSKILLSGTSFGNDSADKYKRYVSRYINTIDTDYICMDFYPYYARQNSLGKTEKYTNDTWIGNLDILAEACRETGRDLWVITQAAGCTKDGAESGPRYCENPEDIAQQAYASLAFGTKAIIHAEFAARGWWDPETSHMIDSQGNCTPTYYAVQKIDGYLAAFADEYGKYDYTSTYLLHPGKVAGYTAGTLATQVESEMGNVKSMNALAVGTFTGDSGKAYVIANMEELEKGITAKATFTCDSGKTVTVYQKGEIKTYTGVEKINLTFEPGDGAYITVK